MFDRRLYGCLWEVIALRFLVLLARCTWSKPQSDLGLWLSKIQIVGAVTQLQAVGFRV